MLGVQVNLIASLNTLAFFSTIVNVTLILDVCNEAQSTLQSSSLDSKGG